MMRLNVSDRERGAVLIHVGDRDDRSARLLRPVDRLRRACGPPAGRRRTPPTRPPSPAPSRWPSSTAADIEPGAVRRRGRWRGEPDLGPGAEHRSGQRHHASARARPGITNDRRPVRAGERLSQSGARQSAADVLRAHPGHHQPGRAGDGHRAGAGRQQRDRACGRWALTDKWYDLSIPTTRRGTPTWTFEDKYERYSRTAQSRPADAGHGGLLPLGADEPAGPVHATTARRRRRHELPGAAGRRHARPHEVGQPEPGADGRLVLPDRPAAARAAQRRAASAIAATSRAATACRSTSATCCGPSRAT